MDVVESQPVHKDEPTLPATGTLTQADIMDHNSQSAAANNGLRELSLNSQTQPGVLPATTGETHDHGPNGVGASKQSAPADQAVSSPAPASSLPSVADLLAPDGDTVMTGETSEPQSKPQPHAEPQAEPEPEPQAEPQTASKLEPLAEPQTIPQPLPEITKSMDSGTDPAVQQPTSDLRTHSEPATAEQASEIRAEKEQTDLATEQELASSVAKESDAPIERSIAAEPQPQSQPAAASEDVMDVTDPATAPTIALNAQDNASGAPTDPAPAPSIEPEAAAVTTASSKLEPPHGLMPHDQDQDHVMSDAPPSPGKVARSREDEGDDEPATKRLKADGDDSQVPQFKVPEVPTAVASTASAAPGIDTAVTEEAAATGATTTDAASGTPAPAPAVYVRAKNDDFSKPITNAQKKAMTKVISNLARSKNSHAFARPVDPVALNIPTYFDHVKKPMDLKTMENKIKNNEYAIVQDFIDDFDQIVINSEIFNGPAHAITAQVYELRKLFDKALPNIPSADFVEPPLPDKKSKRASVDKAAAPRRRESRSSVGGNAKSPTAASPSQAFALGPEGTPLIRRDSTVNDGRPKREIHPPAPKDLPYSMQKPKKKKFQWELKFCQEILNELRKPKYNASAWPFLTPVDPVAMNIPTYHKIIKKPMDLQTMDQKLKSGQYENAKEFEVDMRLIFSNCYKFNPPEDHVHKAGKSLEAVFDDKWESKKQWIADHAPVSSLQSPASSPEPEDDEDDEEEEEEEEEEEDDPQAKQIEQLQKQILAMSKQVEMIQTKKKTPPLPSKKSKSKAAAGASTKPSKKDTKKKGTKSDKKEPSGTKRKNAKIPYVTYEQKQDISNRINTLPENRMTTALTIIRDNMPNLKWQKDANNKQQGVQEDEIELDIDELSNDVLYKLLTFVRKYAPLPKDEEEARAAAAQAAASAGASGAGAAGGTGRPKKNKPMGKVEQEARIKELKDKLNGVSAAAAAATSEDDFNGNARGRSGKPQAAAEESSGDDDSEESEED